MASVPVNPERLSAPPAIETERLRVRLVSEADLPALMTVNGDDEVTRFLPYASWACEADARAWYDGMLQLQATGAALQFVVVDKASDAAIGTCLLFRHDAPSARAKLGYVLGRAHWGRGCMREALQALIGYAFGPLALRRLAAEVDPRNTASAALLQRLGFMREGVLRQHWITKGQPCDAAVFGLLQSEWRAG